MRENWIPDELRLKGAGTCHFTEIIFQNIHMLMVQKEGEQ